MYYGGIFHSAMQVYAINNAERNLSSCFIYSVDQSFSDINNVGMVDFPYVINTKQSDHELTSNTRSIFSWLQ